jgi:CubicO group peptidase (beta-lactamase class C family)
VLAFLEGIEKEKLELHSFVLVRHGKVAAEGWWHPYRQHDVHLLYSLSKSFTSTAVGFAISEGRFGLDDPVLRFFPDDAPADPSENLRAMRVRDLLTMSTGHDEDDFMILRQGDRWVRGFLARPVPHPPGTHFLYNNGSTYTLAKIIQRETGQTLLEYLRPRLFDPVGIGAATWQCDPEGHNLGATGLSVTTDSIARFGQLYLQEGMWEGRRVLPEGWVALATQGHVSNASNSEPDWQQGYGFQFWRCRHEAYRGDGAFGQNCVVVPNRDAVFVTTAGADRLQPILDQFWEHVLPAMGDESLPEDPRAEAELRARLGSLSLAGPGGVADSPVAARVSGRTFAHEGGTFTWSFRKGKCEISIRLGDREHRLTAGTDDWIYGRTDFDSEGEALCAARGCWTDDDTYVLRIQYVLTPASVTLTCRFEADRVRVHLSRGGTFLPADGPEWEAVG